MNYFIGKYGLKQVMGFAAVSASVTASSLVFLPETFFIEKYQQIIQLYRNGLPAKLDDEILSLCMQVRDEIRKDIQNKDLIQFFPVGRLETTCLGSTNMNTGVRIGIPPNFTFTKTSDVAASDIRLIAGKETDWLSPAGESLREALLLSEEAKKFAIARELFLADNYRIPIQSAIASLWIINSYFTGATLNKRFNLVSKTSRAFRFVVYSLVTVVWGAGFIGLRSGILQSYERDADKRASSLGLLYLRGGVEFYEKQLQRNVALRTLMGSYGEKRYTAKGNVSYLIFPTHVPLTTRLEKLKRRLEQDTRPVSPVEPCEVCDIIGGHKHTS